MLLGAETFFVIKNSCHKLKSSNLVNIKFFNFKNH